MSKNSFEKKRLKVLWSSADLQLYDSEFNIEEALTLKAFADNASPTHGSYKPCSKGSLSLITLTSVNRFSYFMADTH